MFLLKHFLINITIIMDVYMYKYNCPRWWGYSQGLRNMNTGNITSEDEVVELAKQDANNYTGSKSCNISLLQKFHVTMKSVKNYAALTGIPFSTPTNNSLENTSEIINK